MRSQVHLSRQKNAILTAHPRQDGWKLYECDEGLSSKLHLRYVLDYLRDAHPGALKKYFALKEVASDDLTGTIGKSHIVEAGSEWDTQKELDSVGWKGSVEIEWHGQPIHYYSWDTYEYGGDDTIVAIATKSNAALRDFHKALGEYGQAREVPANQKLLS